MEISNGGGVVSPEMLKQAPAHVTAGIGRVDLEEPLHRRPAEIERPVRIGTPAIEIGFAIGPAEDPERVGAAWVLRERGFGGVNRLLVDLGFAHSDSIVEQRLGFQCEVVSGEARGLAREHAGQLGHLDLRRDRADDISRDLFLQAENVLQLTVVTLGPEMRPAGTVDELGGDPDPIASPADAAFEDVSNA